MQNNAEPRVGIIGTGVMGAYHTRIAAMSPTGRLVGIYDADAGCAERVARQYDITPYRTLADLCAEVDAVIVATPTNTHAEVAAACLRAGVHVLLEKPMATSPDEAEALLALSRQVARVLMIGHVERFNPAFIALQSLLPGHELFACDLQRVSVAPGRDQSVDIILDLMIHDLDLVLALGGSPHAAPAASGHRVGGRFIDHATALLWFPRGFSAVLTASAVGHEVLRLGRFYTRDCQFVVDFANRQLAVHHHGRSGYARADGEPYQAQQMEQIFVPRQEPLALEQEHFYQAIRTGAPPATDAASALAGLTLAHAIQSQINAQLRG